MNWSAEQEIVIVGAGVSGLACAQFLRMHGADPLVLEAGSRAGGKLWSEKQDGFLLEHGPASLRGSGTELQELVAALGLESRLVGPSPAASRRFILRDGAPKEVPVGVGSFLRSELFSRRGKWRVLAEPFVRRGPAAGPQAKKQNSARGPKQPRGASGHPGVEPAAADETVSSFVTRRLGRELTDYAVEPFVAGIYAGNPDQLSVRSAFPTLAALEARYGSVLRGAMKTRAQARNARRTAGSTSSRSGQLTFHGGVSELTSSMAEALGDRLLFDACVTAASDQGNGFELSVQHGGEERRLRTKRLILAVPAYAAAELIGTTDPAASEALGNIPYPPVLTVNAAVPRNALPAGVDGFGVLIPRIEGRSILGVIYAHSVFPHRAPEDHALFTVFVGGSRDAELLRRYTEGQLLERVVAELQQLLGVRGEPTLLRNVLWERAIPQYTVGHESRMGALADAEQRHPGLHFLGNYRGGVAITNCLSAARQVADRVLGS